MALDLPDHVWFVRSNGGNGSYPIRPEGWGVVGRFVAGMSGWGVAAGMLATVGAVWGPMWVTYTAPFFFAFGAALSAWYFIKTARAHTDYSITYNDYVKAKNSA